MTGARPASRPREDRPGRHDRSGGASGTAAALTVAALGVVFGDIGTSPLYALSSVFRVSGVHPDRAGVYGMISLVTWAITLVVSVKYVTFVMRADNDGEGGGMALVALVLGLRSADRRLTAILVAIGLLGVALFFGDGTVTPAISVISSVEGLRVAAPGVGGLVVPITVALLTLLFAYQHFGTQAISRAFGPIMCGWFLLLALTGTAEIVRAPGILRALSPSYGVTFFVDHPGVGFLSLAAVVLVVTGAEALYADLGQFDRSSIRRAWFLVVFPALLLTYLGQGALILRRPAERATPFFGLLPSWAQVPMVVVAVFATMIASQAVITGAFSVTRQAVQLGFLPRLRILHESLSEGQVYVPVTNWLLYVAVIGLVIGFGSSAALASAYGIAVTGTFMTTSVLFFAIARLGWHTPRWLVLAGLILFLTMDVSFFAANLTKVPTGGWFPLVVGLTLFTVMTTWHRGRRLVSAKRALAEGPLSDFIDRVADGDGPRHRSPGTAVCLSAGHQTTPLALRDSLTFNGTMREQVVILSVETTTAPHLDPSEQIVVDDLDTKGTGIVSLTVKYGFQDRMDVPAALERAAAAGQISRPTPGEVVYLVSKIILVRGDDPGLGRLRKRLFLALAGASRSPVESFHLPTDRTVTIGSYLEL